jgi:16S rRNA (guanine966-N2)-methyltransferase
VLDAYAGSGALGIESLSRGAATATFVDASADAADAIRANLRATGFAQAGTVLTADMSRSLGRVAGPVDLVMMDPPYSDQAILEVAGAVAAADWLASDAILVVEHARRLAVPDKLGNLQRQRDRRYGETVLTIYGRGTFTRAAN